MEAPARLAAAATALFLLLVVVISAAATAVTAGVTNPLAGIWHAVTGDPAKTQTSFSAVDYLNLVASAEHGAPSPQAAAAIAFAAAQIGHPYVWGGTGVNNNDAGYDCSGLTQAAYEYAGVNISRVATAQYSEGVKVDLKSLLPGDLVYYGGPAFAHHVAIYLGLVRGVLTVLNAPAPGGVVRLDPLVAGGDFFAATRPAPTAVFGPSNSPSRAPADQHSDAPHHPNGV